MWTVWLSGSPYMLHNCEADDTAWNFPRCTFMIDTTLISTVRIQDAKTSISCWIGSFSNGETYRCKYDFPKMDHDEDSYHHRGSNWFECPTDVTYYNTSYRIPMTLRLVIRVVVRTSKMDAPIVLCSTRLIVRSWSISFSWSAHWPRQGSHSRSSNQCM